MQKLRFIKFRRKKPKNKKNLSVERIFESHCLNVFDLIKSRGIACISKFEKKYNELFLFNEVFYFLFCAQ